MSSHLLDVIIEIKLKQTHYRNGLNWMVIQLKVLKLLFIDSKIGIIVVLYGIFFSSNCIALHQCSVTVTLKLLRHLMQSLIKGSHMQKADVLLYLNVELR